MLYSVFLVVIISFSFFISILIGPKLIDSRWLVDRISRSREILSSSSLTFCFARWMNQCRSYTFWFAIYSRWSHGGCEYSANISVGYIYFTGRGTATRLQNKHIVSEASAVYYGRYFQALETLEGLGCLLDWVTNFCSDFFFFLFLFFRKLCIIKLFTNLNAIHFQIYTLWNLIIHGMLHCNKIFSFEIDEIKYVYLMKYYIIIIYRNFYRD